MKNRHGALDRANVEWSSKGLKEEDALRGLNNKARRQHIAEQVAELNDLDDIVLIQPDVDFEDDRPWYDQGDGFDDWQADIGWLDQQFFDDPA
jgi:hypothetical protein